MGCEMPPERGTACGEADACPPCSRALGPARVLSPWGVLGTGGGVRKRRSSACPLGASSLSSVQGQKLYHDGKLRKLQVLLHRLTKKPFSCAHAGTFLSEEFRMKPALTWAGRTCALDCGAGRCGEGFMMGQEEGRRGWPGTATADPQTAPRVDGQSGAALSLGSPTDSTTSISSGFMDLQPLGWHPVGDTGKAQGAASHSGCTRSVPGVLVRCRRRTQSSI